MFAKIEKSQLGGVIQGIPSKSYCHRALIMASRADTATTICGVIKSQDVLATIGAITAVGARVEWISERDCVVYPIASYDVNSTINVGESGSTLRFMLPQVAALGTGATFICEGRLKDRSNDELLRIMEIRGLNYLSRKNPITIRGRIKANEYCIRGDISSQFISGLLMALATLEDDSTILLTSPLESSAYVDITIEVMAMFGVEIKEYDNGFFIKGGQTIHASAPIEIELDWSNIAPYLVFSAIKGGLVMEGMKLGSTQGDKVLIPALRGMNADIKLSQRLITIAARPLKAIEFDAVDYPDIVPLLALACAFAEGKSRINNVERLRIKESDRIEAIIATLGALGINASYDGGLIIEGGTPRGGVTLESFNDHRIVMMATIAGLIVDGGVTIKGAEAIDKSYPTFWEDIRSLGGKVDVWE